MNDKHMESVNLLPFYDDKGKGGAILGCEITIFYSIIIKLKESYD